MQQLTVCPNCSAELASAHRFCPSCGQAVSSVSQMPTTPPIARHVSSDSIPIGGFTPGSILNERYRVIGLLGRGGMGEVYRADDLKLGQPVALKFLPKALAEDPVRRERFFAEVRITRQLAHPNICRVYDIAEANGQHFLSMEYIDGEDLASLLKRIGYLPNEKTLEIARQLCAGLAAAHEKGVLHRDLKPANVMIDGHGRVRITDFGLAIIGEDETEPNQVMGTPAYMAPEQFAGKGASVRSDIYALGLILYEIISGKRAFTASTIAEMRERKEGAAPTAPSDIRTGLDPVVERIILRCIEKDPRSRPASVVQVAMALPGGDPLAAAIAAGETPSPEMVAALGAKEGLRPLIAWVLLALVVAGTAGTVFMGRETHLFLRVPIEKPPEVMAERAREFLRKAGYSERPVDSAYGFEGNLQYVRHVVNNTNAEDRWQHLETAGAQFWYRQSPKPLERVLSYPADFMTQEVSRTDPPLQYSGETLVQLDPQGRLVSFQALPPQVASVKEPASPDWTLLFAEAGLDLQQWKPTEPEWTPLWYADARAAWLGTLPHVPNVPVRIEAASFRGKPVSFEIIAPWTRPLRMGESVELWGQQAFSVTAWVLFFLTMAAGGAYFARRNLRLGRGDRRGAVRIVVFVTILLTISWVIEESHVPTIWELQLFFLFAGRTLFGAGLIWLLYIALEPFVRRKWPDMLVSWTRLLAGEWNDPLVGRDALAGAAIGALLSCAAFFIFGLFPRLLGGPPIQPAVITTLSYPSDGLTDILPKLLAAAAGVFPAALAAAFLLVLFRVLLRSQWAAATSWMILRGLLWASVSETFWPGAMLVWILPLLELALLMRFGLLAYMIATFVSTAFTAPLTFDTSIWYAGAGFLIMSLTTAIALFGFRFALAGRPLLPATAMED